VLSSELGKLKLASETAYGNSTSLVASGELSLIEVGLRVRDWRQELKMRKDF
jgi:hypothetical protein